MKWRHAGAAPVLSGVLRAQPRDFVVEERLGFEPAGHGEHLFLRICKTGANTAWVASQLARAAGVRRRDVGFAGRKDRHAATQQWFSIHLPGAALPPVAGWRIDGVEILEATWHTRKLRPGQLASNRFEIVVRELDGSSDDLGERVARLARHGAPNYFGPQRFGRDGANLHLARELFAGRRLDRERRSLALSAARAQLFNAVLARRIGEGTWGAAQAGDCLNLDGSRSWFLCERPDHDIVTRLAAGDVHVTGPLWGAGELPVREQVAELEREVAAQAPEFAHGLARSGLRHQRRALRVLPRALEVECDGERMRVQFVLPGGAFATAVIAELVNVRH